MYEYKDLYTLDFRNVEHYLEIHSVIREALNFPHYYGCNWSAFWDCLTDMTGRPIHMEIIGLDVIRKKFDGTAEKMLEILKDLKHYDDDQYADKITISITENGTRTEIV